MFRVGILYINHNNFYLNGKKVANSLVHYCNYMTIHVKHLPKVIVLFYPRGSFNQSKAESLIKHTKTICKYVQYVQVLPWVYGHKRLDHYLISVGCGVLISSLCIIFWSNHIQKYSQKILINKAVAFDNRYNDIMKLLKSMCYRGHCISKLGVFPNQFMVQVKDKDKQKTMPKLKK